MKPSDLCEKMGLRLTREALARTKRKALRQRCWYGALNGLERSIVDLTIRCVEQVKSAKLRTTLVMILGKVTRAFAPGYLEKVEIVGRRLAAHISHLALSWGNTLAAEWEHDPALTRYLGVDALRCEVSRR